MKKILILTIVLIGLITISSCKKDDDNPTPKTVTYNLRFTNISNNPYLVEVDGTSNILSGNTYKDYKLKRGTYSWKTTQQSGYIIYPTIKSGTVNLDQDKEIVFP